MKKRKKDNQIMEEESDLQEPSPQAEASAEAGEGEAAAPESVSVSDLMQENLRKASSDATEYRDKYFRALAEMENLRKRLGQEKQDMIAYAIDNMLNEFLTPLDNLENALGFTDNLSEELKNWAVGFKMIVGQFKDVLENHGIVPFESVGRKFDPHFHEAVELVETSSEEPDTVIQEIQKGYKHGDRILRVAKVKVSKDLKQKDAPSPADEKEVIIKGEMQWLRKKVTKS